MSFLLLVADSEYLHLELTFNPFELQNFGALDTNGNRRLDRVEIEARGASLAESLLEHLSVRVGSNVVVAETAGLTADPDDHHVALRAHYRVRVDQMPVTIESRLQNLTSPSHLTQVRYLRTDETAGADARKAGAFAQLDARSPRATFPPETPPVASKRSRRSNLPQRGVP